MATVVLWIRGYSSSSNAVILVRELAGAASYETATWFASAGKGSIVVGRANASWTPPPPETTNIPWHLRLEQLGSSDDAVGSRFDFNHLGFHLMGDTNSQRVVLGGTSTAFNAELESIPVPSWFLILLTQVAPAIWFRARCRLAHRPAPCTCLNCGYDLHATPQRCPECGRVLKGIQVHTRERFRLRPLDGTATGLGGSTGGLIAESWELNVESISP
jgi:hypothetical protein